MLKEEDAWRMALAWQELLQEQVLLVQSSTSRRIVESYEWVTLKLGKNALLDVYAFRSACTVWFALSCCPGYSGRENPMFWKRVFGKLREPRLPPSERTQPSCHSFNIYDSVVTDAARFFDDEACIFPRVSLFSSLFGTKNLTMYQAFFYGVQDKTPEMLVIDKQLGDILQELEPFVQWSLTQRVVPVSLNTPMFSMPSEAYNVDALLATLPTASVHAAHLYSTTNLNPRFVVMQLRYAQDFPQEAPKQQVLEALFHKYPIDIKRYHFAIPSAQYVPPEPAPFLRLVMRTDPQVQIRVREAMHTHQGDYDPHLEAICATLPFARSLEFILLTKGSREFTELTKQQWAWMGYAMFHPDGVSSTWSAFKLDGIVVSSEHIEALEAMSFGNNLFAARSGQPAHNRTYHSARIRERGVVHVEPRTDSDVFTTLEGNQVVDACLDAKYDDLQSLPEWVAVIVPTYGLGWTQSSNILDIQTRRAASCHLKSLQFNHKETTMENLVALLSVVGANLQHLDISETNSIDSEALAAILAHCPKLRSLRVWHDGSYWAQDDQSCETTRLDELALLLSDEMKYIPPSDAALSASLCRLSSLRVNICRPSDFDINREALASIFQRLPSLERLHVSGISARVRLNEPLSYTEGREQSWSRMGFDNDDLSTSQLSVSRNGLPLKSFLAFLSVLKLDGATSSAVQWLDRGVLTLIHDFAACRPREIWIENEGKEVTWGRPSAPRRHRDRFRRR